MFDIVTELTLCKIGIETGNRVLPKQQIKPPSAHPKHLLELLAFRTSFPNLVQCYGAVLPTLFHFYGVALRDRSRLDGEALQGPFRLYGAPQLVLLDDCEDELMHRPADCENKVQLQS